jgi:iron complex transport system ATP-binding protein
VRQPHSGDPTETCARIVAIPPAFAADGVSATYPGSTRPAVERVTFQVGSHVSGPGDGGEFGLRPAMGGGEAGAPEGVGEIAVLLGPNGSGKSTLLRLAAGLLAASHGQVRVMGRDVARADRRWLARVVAFVSQGEAVAHGFCVREVVAMGRAPHQGGWMNERPEDRDAVERAIARCDLSRLAERPVETLSGGEQRRVAVARALAQQPRLLLLDEPAAFLDVRHRVELYDLLSDIVAHEHIACVIAMHELDAAARLADTVVIMCAGRTMATGTPSQVMTASNLREAFGVDVDISVHRPTGRPLFVVTGVVTDGGPRAS